MKIRRVLKRLGHGQGLSLFEQIPDKTDADRIPLLIDANGYDYTGMAREIRQRKNVPAVGWSYKDIDIPHPLRHSLHEKRARPVGLDVFHGGDEARRPE